VLFGGGPQQQQQDNFDDDILAALGKFLETEITHL